MSVCKYLHGRPPAICTCKIRQKYINTQKHQLYLPDLSPLPGAEIFLSMRILSALMCITWLFSSCVTLFNGPYTKVHINVPAGTAVSYRGDTIRMAQHPGLRVARARYDILLDAERSPQPLQLTLICDSTSRVINVARTHSWLYYANLYPSFGLGFLADYNKVRRFSYPSRIFIDPRAAAGYSGFMPAGDSRWSYVLAPPLTNVFVFNLSNVNSSGSPWGLSMGVNYQYAPRGYVAVTAGAAVVTPMRLAERFFDSTQRFIQEEAQTKAGVFFSLSNHHSMGRFDISYGLSAANSSSRRLYRSLDRKVVADSVLYTAHTTSFGGSLSASYRLSNSAYAGLQYMPQVWESGTYNRFNYQHLLMLGISWRLNFCTQHSKYFINNINPF